MTLTNLLNVTDGGQQIRITESNKLKTIYEGNATYAPCSDYEVVAVYTQGNTIVIGVI